MASKRKGIIGAVLANRTKSKKNPKPKKQRKPHPVLKKVLTVLFIVMAIGIVCGVVAGTYIYKFSDDYVNNGKKIDLEMYKANQEQTSIIYGYDSDNELVELLRLHGAENRVWMEYNDIPKAMINAFRDLEDKRFNDHKGVDWKRVIGGAIGSGFQQGASTITQQLIKNLTKEDGRTFSRKFYEILNALNLEKHYSKNTIMEAYLNTVYLGNGCYGIKTAAEVYFGKNVEDLNVAECAVIASITQSPAYWDPLTSPEANRERQLYCLDCMLNEGSITKKQYDKAVKFDLIFTNSKNYKGSQVTTDKKEKKYTEADVKYTNPNASTEDSSYYVDYVIDKVISDLQKEYELTYNEAWRKVFFGGLRIYTAVDSDIQAAAERVYEARETFPDEEDTEDDPAAQSAITIMDYSGRIVAMVGGAGEKTTFRGLNRAADSPRQPGSSIKPISVYAPQIEAGNITWSTKVQNYGLNWGSSRWPENYGGSIGSPNSFVTVQYAIEQSLNTVPAQIVDEYGLRIGWDFLIDDLKISTLNTDEEDPDTDYNYSSMCVGGTSTGVTTLEMAAAFAVFGNNGYYFEPYCYYKVTNHDGSEVLLEAGDSSGEQVLSESTSGVMRQLLKTVVSGGTGSGYGVSGFETFGKTGTTSDDKDRWFVGGTPYYVAAVWYGYDTPKEITNTWGNPAGKLFKAVMDDAHEYLDDKSFPSSSGLVARSYCRVSGDLASSGCSSTGTGYYRSNHLPSYCKNCAMIHAVGSDISAAAMAPQATTTEKTTKKASNDKTVTTTKKAKATTTKEATTEAPTTEEPTTDEPPVTTEPVTEEAVD